MQKRKWKKKNIHDLGALVWNAQVHFKSWLNTPVLRSQPGRGLNAALKQGDQRQEVGSPWALCSMIPLRLWPLRTVSVASQPSTAEPLPISGEEWHQTEAPEGSKNQVCPPILIRFADMIWLRLGERTKDRDHYWILFRIKHLCSEPRILNKFWSPKIQSSWFTDGKTEAHNEKGFAQSHTVWGKNTGPWLCGQGPCPPCGLFLFNINRAGQEGGLGAVAVICLVTREHPGWSSYLSRFPPPLLSLRHVNRFPDALPAFKMGSLSRSIRPSNKHLLSTYYMPDTVLGTGEEGVKKLSVHAAYRLIGKTNISK